MAVISAQKHTSHQQGQSSFYGSVLVCCYALRRCYSFFLYRGIEISHTSICRYLIDNFWKKSIITLNLSKQ